MRDKVPLSNIDIENIPGHWLFARIGKKVLRPGGKDFSKEILNIVDVNNKDIVEFAPGLGATTKLISKLKPKSYVGIDLDKTVCDNLSKKYLNFTFINSKVQENNLEDESKDIVLAEAMLTMNDNKEKDIIVKEVNRILKSGGYFAIHEVGYKDGVCDYSIEVSNRSLSNVLNHAIAPLRIKDWEKLLTKNKFEIVEKKDKDRDMLSIKRIIRDEVIFRTLLMGLRLLFNKRLRKRVKSIKNSFKQQNPYIRAFYIVARKN